MERINRPKWKHPGSWRSGTWDSQSAVTLRVRIPNHKFVDFSCGTVRQLAAMRRRSGPSQGCKEGATGVDYFAVKLNKPRLRMSRFLSAVIVLIVLLVLCQPAYEKERDPTEQDDFTRTFEQPIERVYLAAVQVAASHWHLQYSDKETRTLSFSTGRNMRVWEGFDMSVVCLDLGNGRTKVTLHPQKRGEQTQMFAWKEGNRISRDFLSALNKSLAESPQPDQTGAQPSQTGANVTVAIVSIPAGAEIFVDQNFVGNTPSSIAVSTGKHLISVRKRGYKDWERALAVSGGTVNLNAELVSESNSPASNSEATTHPEPERVAQEESGTGWIGVTTKDDAVKGVVITRVLAGSAAEQAGLQVGDVIEEMDGVAVRSGMRFDVAITPQQAGLADSA